METQEQDLMEFSEVNTSNKLQKSFFKNLREDMTNFDIIKFLLVNSFFSILCKVLITVNDSITTSFLGHLEGYKLSPYFIASLIQNIGFKGIGYGFTTTANMLASRYFGQGNMPKLGLVINQGKFVVFVFSLICVLISVFGKSFFALLFPDVNIDLVYVFLLHNSLSIVIMFQTAMQLTYLNSQNNFIFPAILDTLSTVCQYIIFKIVFSLNTEKILSSDEYTFITTAWCLNLFYFLQYILYSLFIYFYKPSPQSNIPFDSSALKVKHFLYQSIYFLFFFMSHFLGGEQLNILVNNFYGKKNSYFDAFTISQKIYFILQKFSMGFSFLILSVTGNLVMRGFYTLLNRITKIFFLVSFSIIFLSVTAVEASADILSEFYTNKSDLLDMIPSYMRLISIIIIPYHLENSLQAILTGHKKQKIPSYFSIGITVVGGLGFGFLFIFGFNMGIDGVFITMAILEILLSIVNIIFLVRLKINLNSNQILI
jgi:Na+-driven multidrug efflux pump